MQKSSILIISLISINIILVIICGFFYLKKDRSEPKIAFVANETVYTSGMDTNDLLTGMTAVDNKDGDISDRIVIEKILENKDKNVAVVYYAVSDYDGNVAKASREFPAEYDNAANSNVTDSEVAETDSTEGAENTEEKSAEELAAEEAARAEEERLAQEEAERIAEEERKAKEEAEAKKKEEEERKAAEKAAAEAERKAASSPYIELNYTECKVPIGGGVPWADAIKTLSDDKDGYARLFKNLVASKFDNTTAGDYEVTLYTVDSNKNKSNTVTMLVHVIQ